MQIRLVALCAIIIAIGCNITIRYKTIMKKTTKIILKTATKYAWRAAKDAAKKQAVKSAKEYISKNASWDESESAGIPAESHSAYRMKPEQGEQIEIILRSMTEEDRADVIEMMRDFYSSDAVLTSGSDEIFNNDITACLSDRPYLEGFVFTISGRQPASEPEESEIEIPSHETNRDDSANDLLGYAMIAHSFSTEYGKPCIWIEDLYLREEGRGFGLASRFFDYLASEYSDALLRLESEHENTHAMEVYKHAGFREMPYIELYKEV